MATYNGVTFEELVDGRLFRPYWQRENNVSVRNIPYGNKDNVQAAGLGNLRLVIDILLSADADIDTLQGSVGSTARTLGALYAGSDIGNVYLINLTNIRRYSETTRWIATATFMREGS